MFKWIVFATAVLFAAPAFAACAIDGPASSEKGSIECERSSLPFLSASPAWPVSSAQQVTTFTEKGLPAGAQFGVFYPFDPHNMAANWQNYQEIVVDADHKSVQFTTEPGTYEYFVWPFQILGPGGRGNGPLYLPTPNIGVLPAGESLTVTFTQAPTSPWWVIR